MGLDDDGTAVFPFPVENPVEEGGSEEDNSYNGGMTSSTTTEASIFDNLDYSHAYGYGGL